MKELTAYDRFLERQHIAKEQHMNEGEKAGRWAMVYLYIALFVVWFNIACIAWHHIKEWFL